MAMDRFPGPTSFACFGGYLVSLLVAGSVTFVLAAGPVSSPKVIFFGCGVGVVVGRIWVGSAGMVSSSVSSFVVVAFPVDYCSIWGCDRNFGRVKVDGASGIAHLADGCQCVAS